MLFCLSISETYSELISDACALLVSVVSNLISNTNNVVSVTDPLVCFFHRDTGQIIFALSNDIVAYCCVIYFLFVECCVIYVGYDIVELVFSLLFFTNLQCHFQYSLVNYK